MDGQHCDLPEYMSRKPHQPHFIPKRWQDQPVRSMTKLGNLLKFTLGVLALLETILGRYISHSMMTTTCNEVNLVDLKTYRGEPGNGTERRKEGIRKTPWKSEWFPELNAGCLTHPDGGHPYIIIPGNTLAQGEVGAPCFPMKI